MICYDWFLLEHFKGDPPTGLGSQSLKFGIRDATSSFEAEAELSEAASCELQLFGLQSPEWSESHAATDAVPRQHHISSETPLSARISTMFAEQGLFHATKFTI